MFPAEVSCAEADCVTAYTDGSAANETRAGGWAFLARWQGVERARLGAEMPTTVNKMELRAIAELFRFLPPARHRIEVFTDSQYALRVIAQLPRVSAGGDWQTLGGAQVRADEVRNLKEMLELWQALSPHISVREIEFVWLKGHSGNRFNDAVDEGATVSRRLLEQICPRRDTHPKSVNLSQPAAQSRRKRK